MNLLKQPRIALCATAMFLISSGMQGAQFQIDLSPALGAGALNAGANPYTQDGAVGLSGLNSSEQNAVTGSGNELGSGINFDNVTNQLSFDFGYGAAFGFTDLVGDFALIHIHGPGLVNYPGVNSNGGVQVDLGGFHAASGTKAGRVIGNVTLDATQESLLFDNALYINIHSTIYPGGEIRAQLIPVPEPSTFAAIAGLLALLAIAMRSRRCD